MGLLRQFFRIVDLQVVLIAALAVAATWGCIAYGIRSDLPSSLIAVAIAYACVLVGLDNIQDRLENPFDGVGDDDVRFDPYHELDTVPPFGDTGSP